MDIQSTSTIGVIDLVNISKDIAQLNLGYLGISIAILGVLGGVFVYFNIKPLKDDLDKQERKINDLKKEADDLLGQSEKQTQQTLEDFKKNQSSALSDMLKQQRETIDLETSNKIQSLESAMLEKIDSLSGAKDSVIKEILSSEVEKKNFFLEKKITDVLEEYKKTSEKNFELFKNKTEADLKKTALDVLDLKAYKYDMEGKMGGIILTIQALERCIEDTPHLIKFKLQDLEGKIGKYDLTPELFLRLKTALGKVESMNNNENKDIIAKIKEKVTLENKPEM